MTVSRPALWWGAFTGFYKPGAQDISSLDRVSLFLYAARSVILVISAQAAIIAGLLAVGVGRFDWPNFIGVLVGFVVAHMISNRAMTISVSRMGTTRRIHHGCATLCIRSRVACLIVARC